jgi:hypothetical protein
MEPSGADGDENRVESIIAALVYLMTHYARTGCPRLAVCVSRHMQALALHPDAAPVLRDICAGLHGVWASASADAPDRQDRKLH